MSLVDTIPGLAMRSKRRRRDAPHFSQAGLVTPNQLRTRPFFVALTCGE